MIKLLRTKRVEVHLSVCNGRSQLLNKLIRHVRQLSINHSLRRSSTNTLPSEALAPTLSPLEFQQTSKIPPVPL